MAKEITNLSGDTSGAGEEDTTPDYSIPSYMRAADSHNLGNLNNSIDAPTSDAPLIQRIYNFAGSSAASGINSFYNTAQWAGNMFSDKDVEYRDTRTLIQGFDEDMAQYYEANRSSADLVGFVASSFIPGLGGVKVFNAGAKALTMAKEGVLGVNMSRGLGVLPGARDLLIKEAIEGYSTGQAAFAITEAKTLKAVASGFGEQVLQSAAFETAVAVTLRKSPILADQDVGDLISNIAYGALVGGAIGGVVDAARATYTINKSLKTLDKKLAPLNQVELGAAGTSASDDLILLRNQLDTTAINAPEGVDPGLFSRVYEDRIRKIDNLSREKFTSLAKGDASLGNRFYETLRVDPTNGYSSKLLNLTEIAPISSRAKLEKTYEIGKEGVESAFAIRTVKMWGDDAGKLSDEATSALHLSDYLTKGQSIKVNPTAVKAGEDSFKINIGEYWSPLKSQYKEALARAVWAMDDTVPALAIPKNSTYLPIGAEDIPMLTKAYREGFKDFKLVTEKGEVVSAPGSREELIKYIAGVKDSTSATLLERGIKSGKDLEYSADRIANITDTPLGYLDGSQYSNQLEDAIFGLQNAQKQHWQKYYANTENPPLQTSVKPWLEPQHIDMVYDTSRLGGIDNFQVEAMTVIKQRQVLQQQSLDVAVNHVLGEQAQLLPEFSESILRGVNRGGAGSTFISSANANYGTAGALAEYVGSIATKWISSAREGISNTFAGVNYAIVNSSADTTRLATILQKARATGEKYVMSDAKDGLILRKVRDYERAISEGSESALPPAIPTGVDEFIAFESPAVSNWVQQHISSTGLRNQKFNSMRHAKGFYDSYDPTTFYPPAPNPDRFKFHAFVVDNSVTGTGHTSMLYAEDAVALQRQIDIARQQGFEAFTKSQTKEYFKARGDYDYSKGFNENYIDTTLARSGASSPFFPLTGKPQEIIEDLMQWHGNQEAIAIREAISTKYSRQFGTLHMQGDQYTAAAKSQSKNPSKFESEIKNPYDDYIKTFLGVSRAAEYPVWKALNDGINVVGDKVYNAISKVFNSAKSPYDLEETNKILQEYGIQNAATSAQLEAFTNHPAGKGAISRFVSAQNSMIATLVLRLDPVNALNNSVGSTILTGAETASVIRAIKSSNSDAIGELAGLMTSKLPGVEDAITSPQKLMANAYANFFKDKGALLTKYKDLNVIVDTPQQFKNLLEHATISGTETAAQLDSKLSKMFSLAKTIGDKGELWTGNKLAEQMNRFVSANIMDQITDIAVRAGVMDTKTANSYINTFVNRTQGNVIASQRPQMFQGPLGQAIGLFQSYQFNIMQQLLRYVGEGSRKDALTLLGLQSTIYGANGLPAFQAINTHIIGTASGNTQHTDAYSSINNIAGKAAGDWLTYGLSSNFLIHPDLKLNLYSRGDINPRTVTVVPTNLADVPIASAWGKLFSSVKGGVEAVANGGDIWKSILSATEQQGLSRPLAGISRVARGAGEGGISFSTTGQGNIVSGNDFYSLTNLARISGAKPLDEAITQDAVYRIQSYSRADTSKRNSLGKAIKTVVTGGGIPSEEQMNSFAESYAKLGGKQEEFTKWYVSQLRAANTPQANKIVSKVNTPYSAYMQEIMGGRVYATPADLLSTQSNQSEE